MMDIKMNHSGDSRGCEESKTHQREFQSEHNKGTKVQNVFLFYTFR